MADHPPASPDTSVLPRMSMASWLQSLTFLGNKMYGYLEAQQAFDKLVSELVTGAHSVIPKHHWLKLTLCVTPTFRNIFELLSLTMRGPPRLPKSMHTYFSFELVLQSRQVTIG